jgi:hypothetical protein
MEVSVTKRAKSADSSAELRLAFLVDGDNASADIIAEMLAEAAKYGDVAIRRVYGDWTKPAMRPWKEVLHEHALIPEIQVANTSGKNATDSALIIDAMDILHVGKVDGFCIVSSDSDFTRLAMRIREEGLYVMGIGQKRTPESFVKACNRFTFAENLRPPAPEPAPARSSREAPKTSTSKPKPAPQAAVPLIHQAYDAQVDEKGCVFMGVLGNGLLKLDPSFDSRTYGYPRLSELIRALPELFIVEESGTGNYVVRKRTTKPIRAHIPE